MYPSRGYLTPSRGSDFRVCPLGLGRLRATSAACPRLEFRAGCVRRRPHVAQRADELVSHKRIGPEPSACVGSHGVFPQEKFRRRSLVPSTCGSKNRPLGVARSKPPQPCPALGPRRKALEDRSPQRDVCGADQRSLLLGRINQPAGRVTTENLVRPRKKCAPPQERGRGFNRPPR
jgi:hypothetical protein